MLNKSSRNLQLSMNNIRKIILLYILLKFCTGESPNLYLDGIQLNSVHESLCKDFMNIENLYSIHVCSFVKFLKESLADEDENYYVIFSLKDQQSNSLTLSYGEKAFVVDNSGVKTIFPKKVDFGKYMKLRLTKTDDKVELEINHSKAKDLSEEEIQDESVNLSKKREYFLDLTRKNPNSYSPRFIPFFRYVTFCIGQKWHPETMPLEVYGLEVSAENRETNDTYENLCLSGINKESMFTFNSSEMWDFKGRNANTETMFNSNSSEIETFKSNEVSATNFNSENLFNKTVISVVDACRDTYVFFFTDYAKSFEDASKMCKTLNGNLPSLDDVIFFRKHFNDIRKNFKNQVKKNAFLGTWISGHSKDDLSTLDNYCYYLNLSSTTEESKFEEHLSDVPCIIEMQYNYCLIPAYSDFTYYGPLLKYDRYYFLKSRNDILILDGEGDSVIERNQNKWILRSQIHKEYCELRSTLAVGRHIWNCTDANQEKFSSLLTFTHCKRNEFACTEGKCLPRSSRCNGVVECSDKSDEENCQPVRKEIGYSTRRAPPPRKNDNLFRIQYFVTIINSDDLTSAKGMAVIDTFIGMLWRDSRIEFWNPVSNEEINCEEIWHPELLMTDEVLAGFRVNYEAYRSSCHVLSSLSEIDPQRVHPFTDPYMGSYVKGEDMEISFIFSGLVNVPCRFDLKKYPFGTQTCNLTFWPDNLLRTVDYEFFFKSLHGSKGKDIVYEGRKALGEYQFVNAFREIVDKKRVKVTLILKNLFGFHMLNSFTPSFLICIISYATYFFPISAFNERIMVSLTSLLVLAALFTQSSNTSVVTPYFKLLDIWYVTLIFFCFMTVISNLMIHKIFLLEETAVKSKTTDGKEENLNDDGEAGRKYLEKYNSTKINFVTIFIFSFLYTILLLLFSLSAAEVM